MPIINFAKKEIICKIVYYGPGLCGKTTNLQSIHAKAPENMRGNLTSVDTRKDRTLFFDLLPMDYGKILDFDLKLQLYTVPGQVYYNASRKIVLKGVDGIVFVADSQRGKMSENIESLQNLEDNLAVLKIDESKIPVVLQYNKRDLKDIYSVQELNDNLNTNNLSFMESIATTGHGVFNTLKAISSVVINNVKSELEAARNRKSTPEVKKEVAPKTFLGRIANFFKLFSR